MASGKTDAHSLVVLDTYLNSSATTPTTGYIALYSVAPTASTAGTELTVADGYAREDALFGAAASGAATNATAVTFTAAGGAWSQIVGHGILSASTAGLLLYWEDSVSGPTLADGDSYEFGIGDISVAES